MKVVNPRVVVLLEGFSLREDKLWNVDSLMLTS